MNPILANCVAGLFGFLFFLLIWGRVVRWGYAVWVALKERKSGATKTQLPVVVLLHSGPWLLVIYLFLAIHFLSAPHRPELNWFFGGALLVPPVIGLTVFRFYQKVRRAKAANVQP